MKKEFLQELINIFNQDKLENPKNIQTESDEYELKMDKPDNNHLMISLTKKINPAEQSLNSFIDKIDDNEWEYITNVFEDLTGKSLKLVDDLFKNKQYDKVENLLRLVLQNHVDKLTNLLKA